MHEPRPGEWSNNRAEDRQVEARKYEAWKAHVNRSSSQRNQALDRFMAAVDRAATPEQVLNEAERLAEINELIHRFTLRGQRTMAAASDGGKGRKTSRPGSKP